MTYAMGRQLTAADMPTARAIVRRAADNDYRFSSLVLGIVTSDTSKCGLQAKDRARLLR
jgi:hypothetical protein